MYQLISGTILLSVLHAFIPHHWLPVLTIGRKEKWSLKETVYVTFLAGTAHAISTVVIGVIIGGLGLELSAQMESFTHWIAPIALIGMGIFFLFQHHNHPFQPNEQRSKAPLSKGKIIGALVVAMFFSPCIEVEAFYLMAGGMGWEAIALISIVYFTITVVGMVAWVGWAYRGIRQWDGQSLERNAGTITGVILILVGIVSVFLH
ncbi:MAG: hypothetical protein AAF990_23450 [Bacteroidota bacterium]